MTDESSITVTADRLSRLMSRGELDSDERKTAMRCHRRLERPLRLTIFGTNPKHAISLLNLLAGQSLVPPAQNQARIQIVYSDTPYAEIQLRDGSRKELSEDQFRDIFVDNPQRVRIGVNLPVLKKVAFMVAANSNPEDLCIDAEQTLSPSDFVLWAGDALTEPVLEVWTNLPTRIRDHSYLALPQTSDHTSWDVIKDEFVDVISIDPRLAQAAKSNRKGVDKEGFEKAGGKAMVKVIKKEIETLRQSALDAAQIMLIRHDADNDDTWESEAASEPLVSETEPDVFVLKSQTEEPPQPSVEEAELRDAPQTEPLASRDVITTPVRKITPDPAAAKPDTDQQAPKRNLRVVSQNARRVSEALEARYGAESKDSDTTKKRVKTEGKVKLVEDSSDEKETKATPWSLGL